MALASIPTYLIITGFFLCTCESVDAKFLWNKIFEVKTLILNYEVKLVRKLIKNKKRFKRFMKCQETYYASHSLVEVYKDLLPSMRELKAEYGGFALDIDDKIFWTQRLLKTYTIFLKEMKFAPKNGGCNAFLSPTRIQDARVKRLIELISRKHAEEAVYMQNTNMKSILEGILQEIRVRTDWWYHMQSIDRINQLKCNC
uniref:DHC_N1 domain-containing protein n=1 Tax=Trichobilharzia regenti TaxID=157069 RepID=A0AA85K5G7_TRIRE|nr:unnamed protein product [Trichobilharzia regenti]